MKNILRTRIVLNAQREEKRESLLSVNLYCDYIIEIYLYVYHMNSLPPFLFHIVPKKSCI